MPLLIILHLFFQAEDGIRDRNVTGVQTYALPIWTISPYFSPKSAIAPIAFASSIDLDSMTIGIFSHIFSLTICSICSKLVLLVASKCVKSKRKRSEERRVGKECRYMCGIARGNRR